jgi:hypothetical protein
VAAAAWWWGPFRKVGEVIQTGIVGKAHYPSWRLALSLTYNVGPLLIALGIAGVPWLRRLGGRAMAAPVAVAAIPTAVLFWMNFRHDVGPRYFAPSVAAGIVLAAASIELLFRSARGRWLAGPALSLVLLSQAPLLASNWVDGQRYPFADAARVVHEHARPGDRVIADWSGIVEYYLEVEHRSPRSVMELPDTLPRLDEAMREGTTARALLVLPRQRGRVSWTGDLALLAKWLERHANLVATLGRGRLDSALNGLGAGYRFEIEVWEVDLVALRGSA